MFFFAAFDTVNHSNIVQMLQHRIGRGGTALMWFASYLRERTQTVAIRVSTAPSVDLQLDVPQGNVLGAILFTIYTLARCMRTSPKLALYVRPYFHLPDSETYRQSVIH